MSFKTFYRINGSPFNNKHDPFSSSAYQQLIKRLNYLLEINGVGVVTGDSGIGKSYLLTKYLNNLDIHHYQFHTINILSGKSPLIISSIANELNIKNYFVDSITIILIKEFLKKQKSKSIKFIFIIDNADRLSLNDLDSLKSVVESLEDLNCIFILVGQNRLIYSLKNQTLSELRGRIMINYTVIPLTEEETKLYIKHRLEEVDVSDDLLTTSAYMALYKLSRGTPRIINALLGRALLIGESIKAKQINEEIIMLASDDSI